MKRLVLGILAAVALTLAPISTPAPVAEAGAWQCYKVGYGSTIGSYCPAYSVFYHKISAYCPSLLWQKRRVSYPQTSGRTSWLPTCPNGYHWSSYIIYTI